MSMPRIFKILRNKRFMPTSKAFHNARTLKYKKGKNGIRRENAFRNKKPSKRSKLQKEEHIERKEVYIEKTDITKIIKRFQEAIEKTQTKFLGDLHSHEVADKYLLSHFMKKISYDLEFELDSNNRSDILLHLKIMEKEMAFYALKRESEIANREKFINIVQRSKNIAKTKFANRLLLEWQQKIANYYKTQLAKEERDFLIKEFGKRNLDLPYYIDYFAIKEVSKKFKLNKKPSQILKIIDVLRITIPSPANFETFVLKQFGYELNKLPYSMKLTDKFELNPIK